MSQALCGRRAVLVLSVFAHELQRQTVHRRPVGRQLHFVAFAIHKNKRKDRGAVEYGLVRNGRGTGCREGVGFQPGRSVTVAVDVADRTAEGFRHGTPELGTVTSLIGFRTQPGNSRDTVSPTITVSQIDAFGA